MLKLSSANSNKKDFKIQLKFRDGVKKITSLTHFKEIT